jgi:hypothetical protein
MPYQLFGFISMTPTLWVFLVAQLTIVVFALLLCFLSATTAGGSRRLVLGNTIALITSIVVSVFTVLAGFLESFAAHGPDNEKAAQLASGILTVMNGFLMAVPFAVILGLVLSFQVTRRVRQPSSDVSHQSSDAS